MLTRLMTVELAALDALQTLRCEPLDSFFRFVSQTGDRGMVWILLAAVLLVQRQERRQGLAVSCALTLDLAVCNGILKPLVGRTRPFVFNPAVELLVRAPADASFPSGHTAASFAAAFALKTTGSPLWKPAMVWAALMGVSRLYLYVHWPSDVLAGAALGALAGWCGGKAARAVRSRTAR